jgi:O-methyltransferase
MKNPEIELKLEFIKFALIGCYYDKKSLNEFFVNGTYPEQSLISEMIQKPIKLERVEGMDQPVEAFTMIGKKRLDNLHDMLNHVRENNIEGDLIETGVWKGGATIFMKIYCDLYGLNKKVYVCDSFEGLPKPSGKFSSDHGDIHYTFKNLAISLESVQQNFNYFHCLDEKVIFIKGFFGQTLPNNDEIKKLSLLRMDGDMYESTHDVFYALYDKVETNAPVIIDDYCLRGCRDCVLDFRSAKNIDEEIITVDRCGIYWIKK